MLKNKLILVFMSIDVNYFSFSPSRADKQWHHIKEDLPALRKRHANRPEYERKAEERQKEIDKIEKSFEVSLLEEIQEKIFNHFKEKGYFIPWIEWDREGEGTDRYGNRMWWNNQEKMEYLLNYGPVYPKNADLNDKNVSYLMLRTDAPELEEEYRQKLQERDDTISNFLKSFPLPPREDENVILNDRQKVLENSYLDDYLIYDQEFNQSRLLTALKYLDLHYGAILNDSFEDPKLESTYLEALINQFHLKAENGLPFKEEWIKLYSNITQKSIQDAESWVARYLDWDKEEVKGILMDFLKSVKPVIKDLKETPDAIFIRMYGGTDEAEPLSAEVLLMKRANQHAKEYKGIATPVW